MSRKRVTLNRACSPPVQPLTIDQHRGEPEKNAILFPDAAGHSGATAMALCIRNVARSLLPSATTVQVHVLVMLNFWKSVTRICSGASR
jgi:hypothetical protein